MTTTPERLQKIKARHDVADLLAEVERLQREHPPLIIFHQDAIESLTKRAEQAEIEIEQWKRRFDRAEAERDALLVIAERFAPCPFVLYPDASRSLYKEACRTCTPKKENRVACLREYAEQEAQKELSR